MAEGFIWDLLLPLSMCHLSCCSSPPSSPSSWHPSSRNMTSSWLMDIDVSPPSHLPSSDRHASQGLLPFPGNIVNGAHEVAHVDLTSFHASTNLSRAGLRELCAFCLAKTGNKTMLTDQLKDFSADWQGWDGGVMKSTKGPGKKTSMKKQSTLCCELLFSAATAAGMGLTTVAYGREMPEEFCDGDEVRAFGTGTEEHWRAWRHIEACFLPDAQN
ncbi:hypothetical protein EDB86DRAFT_2836073 [Lactarius hatsudake]|nr:hypothetical protein EDB86DRAFT_2836073 [Lactarius hatsudake]